MVRQLPGGSESLDHIFPAGYLWLCDDIVPLRLRPKSSHSRENMGLLLVLDDRSVAYIVRAYPSGRPRSFRLSTGNPPGSVRPSRNVAD